MCDSLKTLLWSIVYFILIKPRLVIRTASLMFFYGNQFGVEQDQISSPPEVQKKYCTMVRTVVQVHYLELIL